MSEDPQEHDETRVLNIQFDERVHCWSVLSVLRVSKYLDITDAAYSARGGIRHQRDALKTTSARRIRSRLVEDLKRGAIIPPVVIGLVLDEFSPDVVQSGEALEKMLYDHHADLAIIDGMQRTTALREAAEAVDLGQRSLRVETWIAKSADSLIYRMLVLNTGQVPWNLKQQLNVVFEPLIKSIEEKVKFTRLLQRKEGKAERRWNGGEFSADDLVEAYIAFGLRRTEVETQETLADEFSRLDMADALTTRKYDQYFYPVVQMMVDLDVAVSRFNPEKEGDDRIDDNADGDVKRLIKKEYSRGRHIFDTQPARIGFIVAAAIAVLGRIGMDQSDEQSSLRMIEYREACAKLVAKLQEIPKERLEEFLSLGVLSERLSRRPSSAVGRWERNFFESAFKVLFEVKFDVPSLEPCWRA